MKKNIVKIIYTAMVLDTNKYEHTLPYWIKDLTKNMENKYFHHITLEFGFDTVQLPAYVGEYGEFSVESFRIDSNAAAYYGRFSNSSWRLDIIKSLAEQPHITIATATGVAPVYAGMIPEDKIVSKFYNYEFHGRYGAFVEFENGETGWVFEK